MSGDDISNKEMDQLIEIAENATNEERRFYESDPLAFSLNRFNNHHEVGDLIKFKMNSGKTVCFTVVEKARIKNGVLAFYGYTTDADGSASERKMFRFHYDNRYNLKIDGY